MSDCQHALIPISHAQSATADAHLFPSMHAVIEGATCISLCLSIGGCCVRCAQGDVVLAVDESSVAGLSVFAVESLIFGLVGTRVSALPNPGDIVADACMCLCCANVYMRSVGVVFRLKLRALGGEGRS